MAHIFFTHNGHAASGNLTAAANYDGDMLVYNQSSDKVVVPFSVSTNATLADTSPFRLGGQERSNEHESIIFTGGGSAGTDATLTLPPFASYIVTFTVGSGGTGTISIAQNAVTSSHGNHASLDEQQARVFFDTVN